MSLVSSPLYEISTTSPSKAKGIELISNTLKLIEDAIGGAEKFILTVKQPPACLSGD